MSLESFPRSFQAMMAATAYYEREIEKRAEPNGNCIFHDADKGITKMSLPNGMRVFVCLACYDKAKSGVPIP